MPRTNTRDAIVEKADALFYRTGFEATSFADIADEVGISRGNFYHHFKSKDAILDAVISLRLQRTAQMLDDWEAAATSPRESIVSFIRILIDNRAKIMAHGCPVGTLCSELAKLDHASRGRAADIMALFRDWLERQFRAYGAGAHAGRMALHLLTWSQGVAVMATTLRDPDYIDREVRDIERWLDAQPQSFPQH